ncbi:MAG: glycine/betaine/sarcosine/D-proline family reductase selenoprotein B [Chloroflexi bacterium]|nr:glycine/betaine/sarcosine/D-proline family reductase selenoprotein B [Chloroflexota bacterium]
MAKEIERAGIPTAYITTIVPLAQSVGPNRIVAGKAVIHPTGDPALASDEERAFRRRLVRRALDALETDAREPIVLRLEDRGAGGGLART